MVEGGGNQLVDYVAKLPEVGKDIFNSLATAGIKYVTIQVVKRAVEAAVNALFPPSGLLTALKTIYNGVLWLIDNADRLRSTLETVFKTINTVVNGTASQTGELMFQALNKTVVPLLDLGAKLAGVGDLPKKVREVIDSLDVTKWIYAGAVKLVGGLNLKGLGRASLAGSITVGDPFTVGDFQVKQSKEGELLINGKVPLRTVLNQQWKPKADGSLVNRISREIGMIQGADTKAILAATDALKSAEKRGAATAGPLKERKAAKQQAKKDMAKLKDDLNKLLRQLRGGGFQTVTLSPTNQKDVSKTQLPQSKSRLVLAPYTNYVLQGYNQNPAEYTTELRWVGWRRSSLPYRRRSYRNRREVRAGTQAATARRSAS